MISILFGLASGLSWGAGDFAGGLASRKLGTYRAVFFQEVVGLCLVVAPVLIIREPFFSSRALVFAMLSGVSGNMGLLLFYHALGTRNMSIAAPVSALMTAILPVVAGSLTEGTPGALTFLGFGFALTAVWLVSQDHDSTRGVRAHLSDLVLPLLAGIGFGGFFILIHEASRASTIWPMIASRTTGVIMVGLLMLTRRMPWRVDPSVRAPVAASGVLDISGNLFFILAAQAGRLDVAAVLGSLYPGGTVLLAWLFLKERLSRLQWLGIALAMVAIVLLTL